MLRKRIIFTLIYSDGYFNQSRNFRLQRVGDIKWLEKNYKFQKIAFSLDELIVLNASKEKGDLQGFATTLSQLVEDVFIPIAAGGGIRSMADAEILFASGADKIILNTVLSTDEKLVDGLVKRYGSQSIVASIDYKGTAVFVRDATEKIDMPLSEYIKYVEMLGVGEIYLNAIEKDGTGFGYDVQTITQFASSIGVPLIIAGGAGNEKHLIEGLEIKEVNAVATANLFNFIGDGLPNARVVALESNCNLASWQIEANSIME